MPTAEWTTVAERTRVRSAGDDRTRGLRSPVSRANGEDRSHQRPQVHHFELHACRPHKLYQVVDGVPPNLIV
jgi:hypothetical protein